MDTPTSSRRLVERASFGLRPTDEAPRTGAARKAWLEAELARAPDVAGVPALNELAAQGRGLVRARMGGPPDGSKERELKRELRALRLAIAGRRIARAVHAEEPLQEVMLDFWANHFSVSTRDRRALPFVPEYEASLRRHALGRFETLLLATAKSPAMLLYLDNWRSSGERPGRGRRRGGINENYARELLELHTLGLDGGYDQADVVEAARVLTGWSLRDRSSPRFAFRERLHDPGPKRVLGERIPGAGAEQGVELLRRLARHPSTARHVSFKLARRFVADDPPRSLVERTARRFLETEGDIARVLETLLLDRALGAPENAKLKTPLEWVASTVRATGGETDGRALAPLLFRLGELPWAPRSPAGYPDVAASWIDPGAVLARLGVAGALASGRLRGTRLGDAVPPVENAARARGSGSPRSQLLAIAAPEFQWQ